MSSVQFGPRPVVEPCRVIRELLPVFEHLLPLEFPLVLEHLLVLKHLLQAQVRPVLPRFRCRLCTVTLPKTAARRDLAVPRRLPK